MWEKVWDPESKSFYYWNEETDETTWTEPQELKDEEEEVAPGVEDEELAPGVKKPNLIPKNNNETSEPPPCSNIDALFDPDYYKTKEYADWYYKEYYPSLYQTETKDKGFGDKKTEEQEMNELAPEYKDYQLNAYFNSKTGKFRNTQFDPRFKPKEFFASEEKASRQMSNFFDIDRHNEKVTNQKRRKNEDAPEKLTKKQLDGYKQKKLDKKRASLMLKYAD